MISFRDRAYCSSNTKNHTCGREFTEEDRIAAQKWWGGEGAPVSYGAFCENDVEITGTLKNAVWSDWATGSIEGNCYGDIHGRFTDGTWIYTSTVREDSGDGIYKTMNSVYKVEFADEKGRPEDLPTKGTNTDGN